jgi:hypothetical protein
MATSSDCPKGEQHDWERGDVVDREGTDVIVEYYCLN